MSLYRIKSNENYYKVIDVKTKVVVAVFSKKPEVQQFLKQLFLEIEESEKFAYPERVLPTYFDKKLHLYQEEKNRLYLESKKEKEIKLRSFFTFKDERPVDYSIKRDSLKRKPAKTISIEPELKENTYNIDNEVIDLGPESFSSNEGLLDLGPEQEEEVYLTMRVDDGLGDYMVNTYSKKELKKMHKEEKKEMKYQRKNKNVW